MKTVPFYANESDELHDIAAVYQMLLEYYLGKQTTTSEIEQFIGQEDDVLPSTIQPLTLMARQGFDIHTVSTFDYAAFADQGETYLKKTFSKSVYEQLTGHTNVLQMDLLMPEFLRSVKRTQHTPTLDDLDSMLKEGRLVYLTLNATILQGKKQSSDSSSVSPVNRAVLVLQRKADDFIIHDPGPPARHYERIPRNLMARALAHEDDIPHEMSGFLYRKSHIAHRLDQYVIGKFPRLSRSYAAKLIETGKILVNGKLVKPGHKVQSTDTVTIDYDEPSADAIPQIDLPILYEDESCIVINKPAGVLTHAQTKHGQEATVATFLRGRLRGNELTGERAGIVHRLDRATSGIIICAKTVPALSWLQKQFADRSVQKTYVAVVKGIPKTKEAVIDMPIERNPKAPATFRVGANGKSAITHYEVVESNADHSLVRLQPKTGRTHQLRVHLQKIGHPIIGDPLYGDGAYGDRLYLHAEQLIITLPNGQKQTFTAPLPDAFRAIMKT